MTINAEWSKILKTACPEAYSADNLNRPKAVFVDGQINLMKSDWIVTWDQFVYHQYIRMIDRFFAQGIKVVILGFDDYRFVPSAKNMTQSKRSKSVPKYEFEDSHSLPKGLPVNWAGAMRNRTFKVKVINLVFESLQKKYENLEKGTLFFDFDKVTRFGDECPLPDIFSAAHGSSMKRGECDVKAFSWVGFSPLQIESTDGDFIPMSLLQTMKNPENKIILHRMKTKLKDAGKRTNEGSFKREYEFVNISILYNFLSSEKRPMFHNHMQDECEMKNKAVEIMSTLTSLTGCDFCMNLPKIGPTTVWKYRKLIADTDMKNTEGLLTYLIILYQEIFKKHLTVLSIDAVKLIIENGGIQAAVELYRKVYSSLQRSKLSDSVKSSLFTPARLLAHVKNVQWTISYWSDLHFYKEPLEGDFGYTVKSGKKIEYQGL